MGSSQDDYQQLEKNGEKMQCTLCNTPTDVSEIRKFGHCQECDDKLKADAQQIKDARLALENDPKQEAADKKDPLYLIPTEPMRLAAKALKHGADKYGAYNWRHSKAIKIMTYVGAILRHLFLFIDGEDIDKESGLPHLAHIIATCCVLLDAKRVDLLRDDRPVLPYDIR